MRTKIFLMTAVLAFVSTLIVRYPMSVNAQSSSGQLLAESFLLGTPSGHVSYVRQSGETNWDPGSLEFVWFDFFTYFTTGQLVPGAAIWGSDMEEDPIVTANSAHVTGPVMSNMGFAPPWLPPPPPWGGNFDGFLHEGWWQPGSYEMFYTINDPITGSILDSGTKTFDNVILQP